MAYQYLSKSTRLTNYSVIPNDLFALGLSSTATVLYSKLLNRANLSIANGRVDEHGRIYILYRQEDLAHELGKSVSAVKINLNELVEAGLVEKRRADKGIGLLLWGGVGTGKTYMAACIANALIDQEKRVLMTDFATISNISIFDSSEYVSSLSFYDLLIIDDYGAERNSQFALQNVFDVINRRWESGKPLIVTTNLELDSIKNVESGDITKTRINDRILEMCKPIHMGGDSKRTASGKQKMTTLKEVFSKGGNENE